MSDPAPAKTDRVMVDFMRTAFVVGICLAALLTIGGWWLATFGELGRVAVGGTMAVTGMGVFVGSVIGHGVQLWTENRGPTAP